MQRAFAVAMLATGLVAQEPARPAGKPATPPSRGVQYDSSGWPIVAEPVHTADPAPGPEVRVVRDTGRTGAEPAAANANASATEREPAPTPGLASGMALGSPLLELFQAQRSPAAFRALGGVVVWWRLTIYGAQGEVIGVRELTHTADCAFAERDRIEYQDGRVYGRSGASVFAQRQGMPWPTLAEAAEQELMLFGLQLRLPWCLADGVGYAVVGKDAIDRGGELLQRVVVERRAADGSEGIGPQLDSKPRDRFELVYEAGTGQLREFTHRFASSLQTRRVLLEDWREVGGVRLPFRRIYVDGNQRQTTALEILRIETKRANDRDFRLQ